MSSAFSRAPVAQAQGWGKKADAPLFLQPGATRVLVAAEINLATVDSAWEVGLMELSKEPSMAGLALAEGGFADTLGALPAVWSSRRAYFIAIDKQLLGVSRPDDRQFAARWARQQVGASRPLISKYLQDAAIEATGKTGIVMALDLQDAIGLNKVRKALMSDLARATLIKDTPPDSVAQLLTSIKGLEIKMQFGADITGQIILDFGKDPAILTSIALPLLKDVLTQNGLGLSDLDTWTATSEANKLIYTGKLTVPGFFKVMTLIEAPAPSSTDAPPAAATPGVPPSAADSQAAVIKASQSYFKAISATLDSFSQPSSAGDGAAWLKRASSRIDHLPIVNVDPDLVKWGGEVSSALLNGSQHLAVGQTHITAVAAGAKGANTPTAYIIDNNADYQPDRQAQAHADYAKQTAAMVQASQAERARVMEPVAKLLAETIASRSQVRATMVARYKVEF